jgi:hypothetical protein
MHEILERESAQVVESNADLVAAVKSFVDEQKNCKINITRPIFVQFSGANAKEILKKLIWSEIDTELYVAQRKIAAAVNSWQERQVNTLTPDYLRNYLEPMNTSTKLGSLTLNSYDVNGSLRALMLEVEDFDADGRLVGSKPGWVAIGCYNYMTRWPLADEIVDIRGGELPMAIFRKEHSGCQLMASMVHAVVSNWNQFGKVATVQVLPKQNAATV